MLFTKHTGGAELSKVDTLENWHLLDTLVEISKIDKLEKLVIVHQKTSCLLNYFLNYIHIFTLSHTHTITSYSTLAGLWAA